jgi:hypothetical protein
MPEIIHYIVEQCRTVEVTASSTEDAVRIAAAAFEHGTDTNGSVAHGKGPEGVWGNTTSRIKETQLLASRKN